MIVFWIIIHKRFVASLFYRGFWSTWTPRDSQFLKCNECQKILKLLTRIPSYDQPKTPPIQKYRTKVLTRFHCSFRPHPWKKANLTGLLQVSHNRLMSWNSVKILFTIAWDVNVPAGEAWTFTFPSLPNVRAYLLASQGMSKRNVLTLPQIAKKIPLCFKRFRA